MGEELTVVINDTCRDIQCALDRLRPWESPQCDPRVKAMILTHLEEARLWSLQLVVSQTPFPDSISKARWTGNGHV